MSNLQDRLRWARAEAGKTLSELSAESGVAIGTIGDLVTGRTVRPSAETLHALARALGVSPAWLLSGADPRSLLDDHAAAGEAETADAPRAA